MQYARADYSVVVKNTYFRTHGPRGRNSLEKWTDHHLEAELKFAHLFHDGTKEWPTDMCVRGLMPLSGCDERPLLKPGGHLSEHRPPR
jgi:hypothetical protein